VETSTHVAGQTLFPKPGDIVISSTDDRYHKLANCYIDMGDFSFDASPQQYKRVSSLPACSQEEKANIILKISIDEPHITLRPTRKTLLLVLDVFERFRPIDSSQVRRTRAEYGILFVDRDSTGVETFSIKSWCTMAFRTGERQWVWRS
jgi:hypothetical protein